MLNGCAARRPLATDLGQGLRPHAALSLFAKESRQKGDRDARRRRLRLTLRFSKTRAARMARRLRRRLAVAETPVSAMLGALYGGKAAKRHEAKV